MTLADIDRPVLTVVGEVDEIAPAAGGAGDRPRGARGPRSTSWRCAPATSASSSARPRPQTTWPAVAAWARWRSGEAASCRTIDPPGRRRRAGDRRAPASAPGSASASSSPPGSAAAWRARSPAPPRARPAACGCSPRRSPAQLPRLARLGRLEPGTRVSLGLLLDEQARRRTRGRLLPVRGPRLLTRGGQAPDRQRRPRPRLARRPPGRARRRADEHPAERALGGRGAQPPRRGRRADAPRRPGRPRGRARPGDADRRRPRARRPRRARPSAGEVLVLGGGGEERDLGGARDRHGAHRPRPGRAAGLVRGRTRAAPATSPSSSSPARASARAPTGSPTAAGRCRRSRPPRRRRSRTPTRSTR